MTDYDSLIDNIDNRIKDLSIKHSSDRTNDILCSLLSNSLDLESLTNLEKSFIHVRLHMEYFNKHSKLSREDIKLIHKKLTNIMLNHINYDDLDQ